jgi:hypothetical protein
MSAFPSEADVGAVFLHVSFGPISEVGLVSADATFALDPTTRS